MHIPIRLYLFWFLNICQICLIYSQNIYPAGEGLKTNGNIYAIEFDSTGNRVYVGGKFSAIGNINASNIAFYENGMWHPLGNGVDGIVYTIKLVGSDIFAGGDFETASGVRANYIAKWNGTNWNSLQNGTNTPVKAIEWFHEKLFATGQFTTAGNIPIKSIAVWDGQQWKDSGLDNVLHAKGLTAVNDTLWAWGSAYQSLGGHYHIASYMVNDQWTTLPSPQGSASHLFSSFIRYQNKLYATSENTILKWNGTKWVNYAYAPSDKDLETIFGYNGKLYMILNGEYLSNEILIKSIQNNEVLATIRTSNPLSSLNIAKQHIRQDLWIGGEFIELNHEPFMSLATLRSSHWTNKGNVMAEGHVNSFHYARGYSVAGDPVIVGGNFYFAGDVFTPHIAKWENEEWKPMGEGFNAPVLQVITFRNEIYACGRFTRSGQNSVNHIAKWDGTHWIPVASIIDGIVQGMIVFKDKLYAWGLFQRIGNTGIDYCARFDGIVWKQAFGPWIMDGPGISDLAEWDGKLIAAYKDYKPVRVYEDGSYGTLGDEAIGAGTLLNYNGDLYFGGTRILKYEPPVWRDLYFPDIFSWNYPSLLEMNDQLYCSITNEGLFRYEGEGWNYISYIQPNDALPINDNSYFITGFFPYVIKTECQDPQMFNHVAILEFKPPQIEIHADTHIICTEELISFHANSSALYLNYEWSFAGGTPTFTTEACPVIRYNEPGTYYAKLIGKNGEGADTVELANPIVVLEDCNTNTRSVDTGPFISIFPNPVVDQLNINLNGFQPEAGYLYNATGLLVVGNFIFSIGDDISIDLQSYPPGIYFLALKNNDEVISKKFIKF